MSDNPFPENQPVNPYAPTTTGDQDPFASVQLATRGTRLAAAMIDGVLMLIFVLPLQIFSGFTTRVIEGDVTILEQVVMSFAGWVVFLVLFGYTLATRGQTIGKLLLGIRIVDAETGQLMSFGRVYGLRYLWSLPLVAIAIFIPGTVDDNLINIAMLVDSLMIFRSDRRCLHDLIAGSKVVTVVRGA